LVATAAVSLSPSTVWAGADGSITFAPLSTTSVPTLGGAMLVLLAMFLGFIALRTMRTGSGPGRFSSLLIAALAAGTLLSAAGGVSLLRSANAVMGGNIITLPGGETFPVNTGELNTYDNQSGVLQRVTALTLPQGCSGPASAAESTPITALPAIAPADCTLGGRLAVGQTCGVDCTIATSDYRLKTDIVQVSVAPNGLPLYEFRYRGSDGVYRGVMAQDVLQHSPAAVIQRPDGYLAVDYAQLGLSMEQVR
jgi:hypothetical protein